MNYLQRFAAKCKPQPDGCIVWTGAMSRYGYGVLTTGTAKRGNKKTWRAHRFAYEHYVGPIPEGLVLDHICRNKACVKPSHLEAVPSRVNVVVRGRGITAKNARKTRCKNGHQFDVRNTGNYKGHRYCRACQRETMFRKRTRRKVYSREYLLQVLRDWARDNGRIPNCGEWQRRGEPPSHIPYYQHFGSWPKVIEAAFLDSRQLVLR